MDKVELYEHEFLSAALTMASKECISMIDMEHTKEKQKEK